MRATRFLLFVVVAVSGTFVGSRADATPYVCGTPVTHDFTLTTDIYCPGSAGIYVGANNITIDLGGHTLRGDESSSNYGIDGSGGFDHVTVKNGTVEQFWGGVIFNNVDDGVHVLHVVSAGNVGDGIVVGGARAVVSASQAYGNGTDGIGVEGNFAEVVASRADDNGHDGVVITSGSSALVRSSRATGNGNDGIDILSHSARVMSSQASGNAVDGIALNFSPSSVVSGCEASGNAADGVALSFSGSSVVSGCEASGNAVDGIHIADSVPVRVTTSQARGNVQDGIVIMGDRARVASSGVSGNGYHGIEITGDAPKIGRLPGQSASARNHADGNGYLGGSSDEQGWGIYAHGFSTSPVGRNEASGNDDPTECNPGDLC